MEDRIPRAYRPSLTMHDYTWDSDLKDMYGRDPVEVERRIRVYEKQFEGCPDEETSEEDEAALTVALEMDWVGTVRQLRGGGVESVRDHVRQGNHLDSPF